MATRAEAITRYRIRRAFGRKKSDAEKKGIEFSITLEDIYWPTHCPVLGVPLCYEGTGRVGPARESPSLDRVNPALGYVPGNVRVISHQANTMKSDLSAEQLRRLADYMEGKI